jgi:hypothetical protein
MDKYYKDLLIEKSAYYDEIVESLKIIEKFIKRDEKIIVGGQAIDFALKAKNLKGIYDENAMPDYDIFSDKHFDDAY